MNLIYSHLCQIIQIHAAWILRKIIKPYDRAVSIIEKMFCSFIVHFDQFICLADNADYYHSVTSWSEVMSHYAKFCFTCKNNCLMDYLINF